LLIYDATRATSKESKKKDEDELPGELERFDRSRDFDGLGLDGPLAMGSRSSIYSASLMHELARFVTNIQHETVGKATTNERTGSGGCSFDPVAADHRCPSQTM
jgi:hypothetical protein